MEPPLLMPITSTEDDKDHAVFIDRHGDIVKLPSSLLVTFARLAARGGITRIKRFHIADVYRPQYVFVVRIINTNAHCFLKSGSWTSKTS